MAASTVSTALVTNVRANPPTYNSLAASGRGKLEEIAGSVTIATTSLDDVGDAVMLFDLRASDRLVGLSFYISTSMDTNGTPTLATNVGVYKDVNAAGTSATAVSAACYASAITTLRTASTTGVQVAFATRTLDKMGQTVAEDGGEATTLGAAVRTIGIAASAVSATPVQGILAFRATVIRA